MKNVIYSIVVLFVMFSCSAGETDKTSPVHESEELNLNKKKNTADTSLIIDTLNR